MKPVANITSPRISRVPVVKASRWRASVASMQHDAEADSGLNGELEAPVQQPALCPSGVWARRRHELDPHPCNTVNIVNGRAR